jgi:5-methylcytosine-specific restriction endonuclease McrA
MTVTKRDREIIYDRDDGRCIHCGTTEGLSIQHRINRGFGGSDCLDGYANLVTMCLSANLRLEDDPDFAKRGREQGWKLESHEEPTEVPLVDYEGRSWWLTDSGTKITWEMEVPC